MINLQLLGGLGIEGPDLTASARSRRRHSLALLATVAAASPQAVGRDRLMALLWCESDAERASNSLRQTLHWLRRELGEDVFLPETATGLQLNRSRLRVDLWTYREALEGGALEAAVATYAGPFLNGFQLPGAAEFARWADSEREQLERTQLGALDALACAAEQQGRADEAVRWRRRQTAADPYSSRSALALLKALSAAGDRPGALEYAAVYESMVRSYLETEPDPAVMAFVARLRAERPAPSPAGLPAMKATSLPPAPEPVAAVVAPAAASTTPRTARAARVPRWVLVSAATLVLISLAATSFLHEPVPTTLVLASGAEQVEGRDPGVHLVACDGPACPAGMLPQDAFVVARHDSYAAPAVGTSYIAPVANATTVASPGFSCCTTATFEKEFDLPAAAVVGRITISLVADNRASVSINGVEFGRQEDPWNAVNYSEASIFRTAFAPHPSGRNRLQVKLWDGGGALGLLYQAIVTYEVAVPAMKGKSK